MRRSCINFFKRAGGFFYFSLFALIFFVPGSFAVTKQGNKELTNLIETKNNNSKQKTEKASVQSPDLSKDKMIKNKSHKNIQKEAKEESSYSFRPLLIQGKKRLIQKTKDMKVDSGNIVESKLFFIDIDFKKRMFEHEDIR